MGFMGYRREMQHTVRTASQCHVDCQSVVESLSGHDIQRLHIVFEHFHHRIPGFFCQSVTLGIHGRNRSVSRKCHAQGFGQTVHAVGSEHARAGTARRTGRVLECKELFVPDHLRRMTANRFEHRRQTDSFPVLLTRKHRSARDKHRRDVNPCRGHEHRRYDFVTIRYHDQRVKRVSQRHRFDGISDQLTACQ